MGTKLGGNFDPTKNFDGGFREELPLLLLLINGLGRRDAGRDKGNLREREKGGGQGGGTAPKYHSFSGMELLGPCRKPKKSPALLGTSLCPRLAAAPWVPLCGATSHPALPDPPRAGPAISGAVRAVPTARLAGSPEGTMPPNLPPLPSLLPWGTDRSPLPVWGS